MITNEMDSITQEWETTAVPERWASSASFNNIGKRALPGSWNLAALGSHGIRGDTEGDIRWYVSTSAYDGP